MGAFPLWRPADGTFTVRSKTEGWLARVHPASKDSPEVHERNVPEPRAVRVGQQKVIGLLQEIPEAERSTFADRRTGQFSATFVEIEFDGEAVFVPRSAGDLEESTDEQES